MGDRPVVADGSEPGGNSARLERGHPGLPLGGEGDRDADDVLGSPGLRRDRTPSQLRPRVAGGWGREPRQPPVRRSRSRDPHRQPDRRGEACESRLPGVSGERFQRHAGSRSLRLGSGPRVDGRVPRETARRASAGPPRWQVPVPARSPLRGRARRDRLRRAHRHDGGAPSRVRDVLELRRGRAPLRARTRPTRSRRCASSTSSSAASSGHAAMPHGRTSSSSSPTTARRRAQPSSNGTATASTSSSSVHSSTAA